MKFKSFLKEDKAAEGNKWLADHVKWVMDIHSQSRLEYDDVKNETDNEDTPSLIYFDDHAGAQAISKIALDFKNKKLSSCPIKSTDWEQTIDHGHLEQQVIINAIIDDLSYLPVADTIIFNNCKIKTLKFDKSKDIYGVIKTMSFVDTSRFECGLLGLLKFPHLEDIYNSNTASEETQKALNIVYRCLEQHGHDIIECQNALIDAGLEEFAKF